MLYLNLATITHKFDLMKTLLFVLVVCVLLSCVSTGAPPSTSQAYQDAASQQDEAQFDESALNQKKKAIDMLDQAAAKKEAYARDKKADSLAKQQHALDQDMRDHTAAAKSKKARESLDKDQAAKKILYQRNKSKGSSDKSHLAFKDRGVNDSGEFANDDNESFGNKAYGQKEKAGAVWDNSENSMGQSLDKTKSGSSGGSGGNFAAERGDLYKNGQANSFGNNNAFEMAGKQGWGNKSSSNKGKYDKQSWDKGLVKDNARTNHDDDKINYLNDQSHNKLKSRNALDQGEVFNRKKDASKSVKDKSLKKQSASDRTRAAKAAASKKKKLRAKKSDLATKNAKGRKANKKIINRAGNNRNTAPTNY